MYGLFWLVSFALGIYCVVDVICTEEALIRNLPKTMWLLLVVLVPTVGPIAWLAVGRPPRAGFWPGDTTYRRPRSATWNYRGPDDDPRFLADLGGTPAPAPMPAGDDQARRHELEARETDLRKRELDAREAELARREAELERRKIEGDSGSR